MTTLPSFDAVKLCLISDAEPIRAAVRVCCLPPHQVVVFSLGGFLAADNTVSAYGESLLHSIEDTDAVLVDWSLERAPLINTLCYEVRRRTAQLETFTPVVALCSGGQEEMIAARAAGADEAMGFPIYLPLIQACVAAHRRKAEAVRRATSTKVIHKLEEKQRAARRQAEARAETLAGGLLEELDPFTHAEARITPDAAQRITSEASSFAEALAEELAEGMIEEVADELVLLDEHDIRQVGALRLDRTSYRFHARNEEIDLTPKEFELLTFMMEREDEVCTRDQILNDVWGLDFETGTNMVEVYMHFLRRKLEAHGLEGMIQTVRGRGYRLSVVGVPAA